MEEIEDGHRREQIITHPGRYREKFAEAAARFAQFQNANKTPKNPEERHAIEGNRENVAEAAARFAQSQNAYETLYCERQRRELSTEMCGTIPGSPNQKKNNAGEELVAERKEDNLDFCESISREFAGGAEQEREDEERIMIEYLKATNDSLDEIATACEKASQSLERVEKTITSLAPIIERMYRKSAPADVTAADDATAAGSGSGSGGGKSPLASVNNSRAEQRDSPKGFWSEEEVESDSI